MAKTKRIDKIREALVDDVFSMTELENIMEGFGYMPVEEEEDDEEDSIETEAIVLKFTNGASTVIIEPESYEDDCIAIGQKSHDGKRSSINLSTRRANQYTKSRVFQSFEDLKATMDYFKEHEEYDYWLTGWLCALLGRRIGDVVGFRWSTLFTPNGAFQDRLETLKEEKTGKVVKALINECAHVIIKEYIDIMGINICEVYHNRIFLDEGNKIDSSTKNPKKNYYESFRKCLKEATAAAGITYHVGSHSFRKWYGNTIYKLHPNDVDTLEIVCQFMGHSDIKTTLRYIEAFNNKADKMMTDYSDYMLNKMKGIDTEINNSPVVTFRTEDFRNILSLCWDKAQSGAEKYDGLNEILGAAEKLML